MYKEYLSVKEQEMFKPFIKNIVVLESDNIAGDRQSFRFFADGLPGIIFQQSNHAMFLNEKKLSNLFLYGQTVKPIEIHTSGSYRMIIVFLYPHILHALFNVEAKELTDTCIDVELLPLKGVQLLNEQLSGSDSIASQKTLLLGFLSELISQNKFSLQQDLQYVTGQLIQTSGELPLKVFQQELNISERTFERIFLRHVGISPNLFARICRFNAALQQIRAGNYNKLTDIAYDNGFSDQSHLGRTFKEFTGLTPGEYVLHYQVAAGKI